MVDTPVENNFTNLIQNKKKKSLIITEKWFIELVLGFYE